MDGRRQGEVAVLERRREGVKSLEAMFLRRLFGVLSARCEKVSSWFEVK